MTWPDGQTYEGAFALGQPSGTGVMRYADGNVYQGDWAVGKRSGKGTLTTADGKIIEGDWMNDAINGKGKVTFANGDIYEGVLTDTKITGVGTLTTKEGDVCEGTFEDGRPVKYKRTSKNGEMREGELRDGHLYETVKEKKTIRIPGSDTEVTKSCFMETTTVNGIVQGKRRLTASDGTDLSGIFDGDGNMQEGDGVLVMGNARLEGHFVGFRLEGEGTFYNLPGELEGTKYVGLFKDGQPNGQGTMTQPHGGSVVGEWKDGEQWNMACKNYRYDNEREYTVNYVSGKREGQGTLYVYSGDNRGDQYVGQWKDGLFNGQGTYTWADGSKYVGQYKDDKRNGQGTYTWADGRKYVGQWVNDQRCGQGTFTWPNGDKYVGQWADDKMNGQGTRTYGPNQPWIKATGVFRNGAHVSGTLVRTNGTFVGEWNEDGTAKSVRKIK
ncbi:MAG: hypothetical protein IKH22_03685 [Prevotella sp.]|nr:hypothetical protein [Prevotella sp.]